MYICDDCGSVFEDDELKEVKEWSEAWGHLVYESFYYCPFCGSDDYHAYREPEIDDEEEAIIPPTKHYSEEIDDLIEQVREMKAGKRTRAVTRSIEEIRKERGEDWHLNKTNN